MYYFRVFPPSQASVAEDDVLRKKMERMQWIKPEHIEIQVRCRAGCCDVKRQ